MTEKTIAYSLTELELIILDAYFLALPVPPLVFGDLDIGDDEIRESLGETIKSLVDKGFILEGREETKSGLILPDLANKLRAIAYGNQLAYYFISDKEKNSRHIAIYQYKKNYVQQELAQGNVHIIKQVDGIGKSLIMEKLVIAAEGIPGDQVILPFEIWVNLLAIRQGNVKEDFITSIEQAASKSQKENTEQKMSFVHDVIEAKTVLELTLFYDRIEKNSEKIGFVLTKNSNWMVMNIPSNPDNDKLLTSLKVSRKSLLLATESMYSFLSASADKEGEQG